MLSIKKKIFECLLWKGKYFCQDFYWGTISYRSPLKKYIHRSSRERTTLTGHMQWKYILQVLNREDILYMSPTQIGEFLQAFLRGKILTNIPVHVDKLLIFYKNEAFHKSALDETNFAVFCYHWATTRKYQEISKTFFLNFHSKIPRNRLPTKNIYRQKPFWRKFIFRGKPLERSL